MIDFGFSALEDDVCHQQRASIINDFSGKHYLCKLDTSIELLSYCKPLENSVQCL